jgi:acetamidase/formamidase
MPGIRLKCAFSLSCRAFLMERQDAAWPQPAAARQRQAAEQGHCVRSQAQRGLFEPGVEVPLGPFMGVMGLLPPASDGPNRLQQPTRCVRRQPGLQGAHGRLNAVHAGVSKAGCSSRAIARGAG